MSKSSELKVRCLAYIGDMRIGRECRVQRDITPSVVTLFERSTVVPAMLTLEMVGKQRRH
jgi:hypothetical protein